MKTHFFIFILFFSCQLQLFSQIAPQKAPVNPDFIKFNEDKRKSEPAKITSEGHTLGGIPPVIKNNFDNLMAKYNKGAMDYPAVYDMRTNGLLTSVKNQEDCGSCWAFATMGSVESRWKKLGLGEFDLSENNLKNCHGFEWTPCFGGNHFLSTAYFARRAGAIQETDDPYFDIEQSCLTGLTPVSFITNARFLPNNVNIIKQILLNYGAVYTMFYWSGTYYNSTDKTYFYNGTSGVNHAVTIVGWDDNKTTAGGTGAWIIKNSWGISWGENGFFYISYNDASILDYNAIWTTSIQLNSNSQIYLNDELGECSDMGYDIPTGYGLVKYIAGDYQQIKSIGTYLPSGNASLKLEIYDNFNPATGVLSNLLYTVAEQTYDFPGYYTFNLSSALNINQGNDFYIKVKYYTPGYNYPIPIECAVSDYSAPTIQTGVHWVSDTGNPGSWYQLAANPDYMWDLCIHAYAENVNFVHGTILLEGLVNPNGTSMHKVQDNSGNKFPGKIADQITVEIAQNTSPYSVLYTIDSVNIDTTGHFTAAFPKNYSSSYYLIVKHHNSIETWSATPVSFSGGTANYNFTDNVSKAYGSNLKDVSGTFVIYGGDANQDGFVDSGDMTPVDNDATNFAMGYLATDINGDGFVDSADMTIIDNNAANFVSAMFP
ncbi:MAG: lectin like domain-containing protein [Lentimicrobiaceae bacterium]|nr:lectin like domain-containing protein [Lentimicrobiaceae bacterium]